MITTSFAYLFRGVIDGDLDGLTGRADVDHHQHVIVTDLKKEERMDQPTNVKINDKNNDKTIKKQASE